MTEAMKQSAIRDELLAQHQSIRGLIGETRGAIASVGTGRNSHADLLMMLSRLAGALSEHNTREESLLKDVIPLVDAWGPARAEVMYAQHTKEHDLLYHSLLNLGRGGEDVAITALAVLLDKLDEHMLHEEEAFLCEDVLHDDFLPRGTITG